VQSLGDRTYRTLKWSVLVGDFGLGERLGEERLAALVGASRTPVREALLRLHAEGLVDRLPDGGYTPSVPDLPAVSELYEVRMALELEALRRPEATRTPHDRRMIETLHATWLGYRAAPPEPDPAFVIADEGFHITLAAAAGNACLVEFLRMVNERIRSVRMRDFLTPERIAVTIGEHLGILEPVLGGDVTTAAARLRTHLLGSMDIVRRRAAGALQRMAARDHGRS
jgi:DNA-binding GntR family transcriptional regulator